MRISSVSFRSSVIALVIVAFAIGAAGCESSASKAKRSEVKPIADGTVPDPFDAGAGKPPTPATMYSLARILTAQGKTTQAVGTLRNLIERYPDYSPAYNALAELYLSIDRTDDAISVLTAGVTRQPKDPVLLNNLGMVYFLNDDYASALANFDRAAAADPGNATYRSNKAAALGMLGRPAEAAELYRKHLRPADVHENIDVLRRARQMSASQARSAAPRPTTVEPAGAPQ